MKLFILGSGTCVPYRRRGSSGYALRLSKSTLLLDCGNGATWKLGKVGINYLDVDHIFLSHFHPDHTADLIPFLFATKYGQGAQRTKPLYIRGAKGFINFLSALEKAYKGWIIPDELNLEEIEEGMIKFDDFTLIARKTAHIESSLAYRIESQGKSLVYFR
ncbi:MAG: ribonuclease Z [Thermodesulfobacteriota bacterium]